LKNYFVSFTLSPPCEVAAPQVAPEALLFSYLLGQGFTTFLVG
jgi:hypothetical protein